MPLPALCDRLLCQLTQRSLLNVQLPSISRGDRWFACVQPQASSDSFLLNISHSPGKVLLKIRLAICLPTDNIPGHKKQEIFFKKDSVTILMNEYVLSEDRIIFQSKASYFVMETFNKLYNNAQALCSSALLCSQQFLENYSFLSRNELQLNFKNGVKENKRFKRKKI